MSDGKGTRNNSPIKPTKIPGSGINKTADVVKIEPTAKPGSGNSTTRNEPTNIPSKGIRITESYLKKEK